MLMEVSGGRHSHLIPGGRQYCLLQATSRAAVRGGSIAS
jgi:hypothetical protein